MKVHADILKMVGTKEKRERIKWYHARRVFFDKGTSAGCFAQGLELAKESEHPGARFFVSLFRDGAPTTAQEAKSVFLAHAEVDARSMCWRPFAHKLPQKCTK